MSLDRKRQSPARERITQMQQDKLRDWILKNTCQKHPLYSRIHKINRNCKDSNSPHCNIMREDELSSGIIGSKFRKYTSLIPYLKKRGVAQVGIIGGPNSNNTLAALQLMKENGIHPMLFIRRAADESLKGNSLYSSMLCSANERIIIEREKWPSVETSAKKWADEQCAAGIKTVYVSEGAFEFASIAGTMTLAQEILRQEKKQNTVFENIYIDSGTGTSAIGLILGLRYLDTTPRKVGVTLIAGEEDEFKQKLSCQTKWLQEQMEDELEPISEIDTYFLQPPTAKSFGAINKTLLEKTISIAREYGLLMDPIYSVKHFMAMEKHMAQFPDETPPLFVFNGGSLGLSGFQEQLRNTLLAFD